MFCERGGRILGSLSLLKFQSFSQENLCCHGSRNPFRMWTFSSFGQMLWEIQFRLFAKCFEKYRGLADPPPHPHPQSVQLGHIYSSTGIISCWSEKNSISFKSESGRAKPVFKCPAFRSSESPKGNGWLAFSFSQLDLFISLKTVCLQTSGLPRSICSFLPRMPHCSVFQAVPTGRVSYDHCQWKCWDN